MDRHDPAFLHFVPPQRVQDIILDSVADGVFTVDGQWRITSFNRAAEGISGVCRTEAFGRRCCDVFRANICAISAIVVRSQSPFAAQQLMYVVNNRPEAAAVNPATVMREFFDTFIDTSAKILMLTWPGLLLPGESA